MDHFVKPSYGKIYHFCHTPQGICVSNVTAESESDFKVVCADGKEDFDVIIDNNDTVHLVCQNNEGDIIYMYSTKEGWIKNTVLKSRTKESTPKNFSLIRIGNILNIIYRLEYKKSYLITHQIIGNDSKTPDVLDYTNGEFSVAKDRYNNIFVCYYSLTHQNFGYMVYMWSKKIWSEFIPFHIEGVVKNPHAFFDKKDILHITGTLDGEIIYYKDELIKFGKGNSPVFVEKDNLYILWESLPDKKIKGACSTDNGNSFSVTTEFMAGRFLSSKLYNLSYTIYEESCNAKNCYGYISEGTVKFYLAPDFFNISRVPPKPVEQSIYKEAQEFRYSLLNKHDNISLEKLSAKLDMVLKELNHIKNSLSNL